MKVSYRKHFGESGTVYTQRVRMTYQEWSNLYAAFQAELARNLPRKKEYLWTSGSETYMRMPQTTTVRNTSGDVLVYLNLTQARFAALFLPVSLHEDRNTYLLINTK